MLRYKSDILEELKEAGYTTTRLRREKLLGESVIQKLRHREPLSWNELDKICGWLGVQPGDILEYVPGEK